MSLCHAVLTWIAIAVLAVLCLCSIGGCTFHATHEHNMHLGPPRKPPAPGPIGVGDTVRLRSGGALMTVRRIDRERGRAQCEWVGEVVGMPHRAWFDLSVLQRENP